MAVVMPYATETITLKYISMSRTTYLCLKELENKHCVYFKALKNYEAAIISCLPYSDILKISSDWRATSPILTAFSWTLMLKTASSVTSVRPVRGLLRSGIFLGPRT